VVLRPNRLWIGLSEGKLVCAFPPMLLESMRGIYSKTLWAGADQATVMR
jgi:hypothetical protein